MFLSRLYKYQINHVHNFIYSKFLLNNIINLNYLKNIICLLRFKIKTKSLKKISKILLLIFFFLLFISFGRSIKFTKYKLKKNIYLHKIFITLTHNISYDFLEKLVLFSLRNFKYSDSIIFKPTQYSNIYLIISQQFFKFYLFNIFEKFFIYIKEKNNDLIYISFLFNFYIKDISKLIIHINYLKLFHLPINFRTYI